MSANADDLRRSLARAREFALRAVIRADGTGFPEAADGREIRPWGGTADGMMLLLHCGEPPGSTLLRACARWLYQAQAPDGSWDSRGAPLTEATAMAVVALRMAGRPRSYEIGNALAFVRSNQLASGGFASSAGHEARLYATCLALWALHGDDDSAAARERGISWLLDAPARDGQDGPWPATPGDEASPAHTAVCLFVLSMHGIDQTNTRVREAVSWLTGLAGADMSPEIELHRAGPRSVEIRTIHLTPALVALALMEQGLPPVHPAVQELLQRLLALQDPNTGGFRNGRPAEGLYVWATARCAHAIHNALQAPSFSDAALAIRSELDAIQVRVDKLDRGLQSHARGAVRIAWGIAAATVLTVVIIRTNADRRVWDLVGSGWGLMVRVMTDQGWYSVVFDLVFSAGVAAVGLGAKRYRNRLTKALRRFWRRIRPW